MRDGITFRCTVCNNENYISKKNKKKTPDRIEIKKFCSTCNKSTPHKEKK